MSYFQSQDPTLERSFRGHKDVVTSLTFKPSMTQLASASMDCSVLIWNFKPQLRAFRFVGHKGHVTSVDFAPTGSLLASSSRDKTVRLWTPNVKGDVTVFKAHTSTVRTVQFSRDSELLLTTSDDKTIKIWSTHRSKFQYTLAGHLNWVRTAKFAPDTRLVVSGSDDKTIKLWDLSNKMCVKTYWDHSGIITSTAFHPSGTIVASASTDRSIKLFDIRMHKLIQHYGDAHGGMTSGAGAAAGERPSGGVNSISFGGVGGEWLISTGMDGLVKVWDLKEGHLFYTLYGHKHGPTTAAVFSPTGDYFATGGSDSQVMVWKSNFDETQSSAEDVGIFGASHQPKGRPKSPVIANIVPTQGGKGITHYQPTQQQIQQTQPAGVLKKSQSPRLRSSQPVSEEEPVIIQVDGSEEQNVAADWDGNGYPIRSSEPHKYDYGSYRVDLREPDIRNPQQRGQGFVPAHAPSRDFSGYSNPSARQGAADDTVVSTIQGMARQIDVLTQTMNILESRITMNEDRVVEMTRRLTDVVDRMDRILVAKETRPTLISTGEPEQTPFSPASGSRGPATGSLSAGLSHTTTPVLKPNIGGHREIAHSSTSSEAS
ncbi:WD40-repeat-containing domain protein [Polychytrium aggregatum]|uniref:WD40-repeat-containing domain protein n=1 Tax=Polychytrium aggregatum TaxID=110093 RepID=UPI0022FE9CCF|nr:WD40-repeat-containing domain protein [Polychytrium aggregatum]KAI9203679.1 WD40-repeat-containing domain protein [Polychytrium aggregatum]